MTCKKCEYEIILLIDTRYMCNHGIELTKDEIVELFLTYDYQSETLGSVRSIVTGEPITSFHRRIPINK